LEICAGGVHDQLWQKNPVEETEEILVCLIFSKHGRRRPERSRFSGGEKDLTAHGTYRQAAPSAPLR
jgi:hypothetical protein